MIMTLSHHHHHHHHHHHLLRQRHHQIKASRPYFRCIAFKQDRMKDRQMRKDELERYLVAIGKIEAIDHT